MDFTILSNGIQTYILNVILIAAAIGSVVNMLKGIFVLLYPKVIKTKSYKLFLILNPYIIGTILFLLAKAVGQKPDLIILVLAASLSSVLYRVITKIIDLYVSKNIKEK